MRSSLENISPDVLRTHLAPFLDLQALNQLRHCSQRFFGDPKLLELERQLQPSRILMSDCGEVVYTRNKLYVSTKDIHGYWCRARNQTVLAGQKTRFGLKCLAPPFFKIPIPLPNPEEKIVQMMVYLSQIFMLTNLGRPFIITLDDHDQYFRLTPIDIDGQLHANERLTLIAGRYFISNQGRRFSKSFQDERLLEAPLTINTTPVRFEKMCYIDKFNHGGLQESWSSSYVFSTKENQLYVLYGGFPELLPTFEHGTIKDFKSTNTSLFILNTAGQLFSMKYNNLDGGYQPCFDQKVNGISAGCNHVSLLSEEGEIYSQGSNLDGQLGIGNKTDASNFTQAAAPSMKCGEYIVTFQCGNHFSAITTNQGRMFFSGRGLMAGLWPSLNFKTQPETSVIGALLPEPGLLGRISMAIPILVAAILLKKIEGFDLLTKLGMVSIPLIGLYANSEKARLICLSNFLLAHILRISGIDRAMDDYEVKIWGIYGTFVTLFILYVDKATDLDSEYNQALSRELNLNP